MDPKILSAQISAIATCIQRVSANGNASDVYAVHVLNSLSDALIECIVKLSIELDCELY